MPRECSFLECPRPHAARGLCHTHYERLRRNSSLPPKPTFTAEELFWAKVERSGDSDCWRWRGATGQHGHGQVVRAQVQIQAHRYVYEDIYGGIIPEGFVLDHQCRNPGCVNPRHLKPVTVKQNAENLGLAKINKSGYRGVYKHSQYDTWVVNVNDNGKTVYGGVYTDVLEAAKVARELRNTLYTNNINDRMHAEEENNDA